MSRIKFDEYRFHFRPEGKHIDLFTDEAMKTKNTLVKNLLEGDFTIKYRGGDLKYQKHTLKNNRYHIRLANRRKTKVERNFQSAYIENEPSCNIFIWNNPNEQKIFIESDKTSFNDSKTVAKILIKNINEELTGTHLNIDIRKELLETEFWDLAKQYKNQITQIEFKLIYPNLPAAHKHISEELNEVQKSLGSYESVIAFKSEDDNILTNVNKNNKHLSDLNNATSIQGTPVSIMIRNFKSKIKTGKTTKSITVDEAIITANTVAEVERLSDKLFNSK